MKDNYIFEYILLKLAMRCNINCTYCYWFRDPSVYNKPGILTKEAEDAFLIKLSNHIRKYDLKKFSILFHGGEPLLFGHKRFKSFAQKLRNLEEELKFKLDLSITTNGLLINQTWAKLFTEFGVKVTVSIDGPKIVHDKKRIDFRGNGTFDKVIAALQILESAGGQFGTLAVCDPLEDPEEICNFFINDLGLKSFDILIPDATHDDYPKPLSIAPFYKKLFDLWYNSYSEKGIRIRLLESISKGLLGLRSHSESIGYGSISTFTMLTDGSLEPLDVLRIAGTEHTKTEFNVFDHQLQEVQSDPLWREVREASLNLAPECEVCPYKFPCGGGHLSSRWSKDKRYKNPSVYCEDFKEIFSHAWGKIVKDIYLETGDEKIPFTSV